MQYHKAQIHFHTGYDPYDYDFINFSPFDAIDKSAELGYRFLSFTHHNGLIVDPEITDYAFYKGIILIPGVEITIKRKHILVYNPDKDIEKLKTFEDLISYKKFKENIFIIAPHPFYPMTNSLRGDMYKYPQLFDAIEYNMIYGSKFGVLPNNKAVEFAKKYNKPLIGNGDVHELDYIDDTHSLVKVDLDFSNLTKNNIQDYIDNFFHNISKNNIEIISKPLDMKKIASIYSFFIKGVTKRFILKHTGLRRGFDINKYKRNN